ncbi:MAG: DUF3365 domain-containing protein [Hydrogenophilales bacterium]|nr:DUF3365 domain-containing protein [Hydrogenophilales bacterium]
MTPSQLTFALLSACLLAACASSPNAEKQAAMADEARKAAGSLAQTLGGELKQAMTAGGPEAAIAVCKDKAPKIAADITQKTGMQVTRVSPKNRNPGAVPDAWEAQALADLERRLAAGEKPETLDTWQVVDTPKGKVFRYAKGLPVGAVCLNCHGELITDGVKAKLATEYPNDKATGYKAGMLRGLISIKRPL